MELREGVLPIQNLLVKSIPRSVLKPGKTPSIAKRETSVVLTTTMKKNKRQYRDFTDFVKRYQKVNFRTSGVYLKMSKVFKFILLNQSI